MGKTDGTFIYQINVNCSRLLFSSDDRYDVEAMDSSYKDYANRTTSA